MTQSKSPGQKSKAAAEVPANLNTTCTRLRALRDVRRDLLRLELHHLLLSFSSAFGWGLNLTDVLNLRLVKFINSTALGGLIKASKILTANGGQLQISRPSRFCKDIIEKVGLDRVIPVHESDEAAAAAFGLEAPESQSNADFEVDKSSVIFSPTDLSRVEHFLSEEDRGNGPVNPVH